MNATFLKQYVAKIAFTLALAVMSLVTFLETGDCQEKINPYALTKTLYTDLFKGPSRWKFSMVAPLSDVAMMDGEITHSIVGDYSTPGPETTEAEVYFSSTWTDPDLYNANFNPYAPYKNEGVINFSAFRIVLLEVTNQGHIEPKKVLRDTHMDEILSEGLLAVENRLNQIAKTEGLKQRWALAPLLNLDQIPWEFLSPHIRLEILSLATETIELVEKLIQSPALSDNQRAEVLMASSSLLLINTYTNLFPFEPGVQGVQDVLQSYGFKFLSDLKSELQKLKSQALDLTSNNLTNIQIEALQLLLGITHKRPLQSEDLDPLLNILAFVDDVSNLVEATLRQIMKPDTVVMNLLTALTDLQYNGTCERLLEAR